MSSYHFWIPAILSVWLLIAPERVSAESLTLAVVGTAAEEVNLLESETWFAQLVRSATLQSLVESTPDRGKVRLQIADQMAVSADKESVKLHIRAGSRFHSGAYITPMDALYSLERCKTRGKLPQLRKAERLESERGSGSWIKIIWADPAEFSSGMQSLSQCPILPARASRLWQEDLGRSNLLVGSAPYQVLTRNKNREIFLAHDEGNGKVWAKNLSIRSFAEADAALSALQTGTVDAVFFNDSKVEERASRDSTLLLHSCESYKILARHALEISCLSTIEPSTIRYRS